MSWNKNNMIELQNLLKEQNHIVTTAESCTGGQIANMITQIPNSSSIFNGAIIAYSDTIKHKELNVNIDILKRYGAVSKEVVLQMLDGVVDKFDATIGIAISGIAGPTGETKTKKVGNVIIGIIDTKENQIYIYQCYFKGDRIQVQTRASWFALTKLLILLKKS